MSAKLTYSSLPIEIKRIGNEALGVGVLKSLFSYTSTYHLMIKISDGEFIGFALYHFEKRKVNKDTVTVGVVDAVCVAKDYRKEGFGSLLTFSVLRKMSAYNADRVEITLKTPRWSDRDGEPGIPLTGSTDLLKLLGFKQIHVMHDHYLTISKKYGYDCNFCGNRPDTCKGVLFAIDAQ